MLLDSSKLTLIFIDIQEKLLPKIFNNKEIMKNCQKIIEVSNYLKIPTIMSEQYPKGLGNTVKPINDLLIKGDFEKFEKSSFSCFGSAEFSDYFFKQKKTQVILCGIEAHICVLQTAYDLIFQGIEVYLINEAIGSRKNLDKSLALERMQKWGINVINFEMFAFELIKDSNHKHFKEISSLVK